jgi:hypothetical protein
VREDYGEFWNMGRADCWRWEVGGVEVEETQSQWPGDACKERQGNNAATSPGCSRRTKTKGPHIQSLA